ncbi:MAG: 50S ribosomal protein L13 [Thermoprotei archaeon]|nr:MAG: 50S ribosomal protein L13 [Thermoprotei archaeon]RLE89236.1 MAG: 50S ribosomal protein L13 [Thermoprotei archaeon]
MSERPVVIDARNLVMGRLASVVAKRLLKGERIVVVNIENAVITGDYQRVVRFYKKRIEEWRTHYNPEKRGPKLPRRPDRIFKRTVRGMLPRRKKRGRDALRRLRVYIGTPPEYRDIEKETVPEAFIERIDEKYITLRELSKEIGGWRE